MSDENNAMLSDVDEKDGKVWAQVLSMFFISGVLVTLVGGIFAFAWFITIFFAWFVIPAGFAYFIIVAITASIKRNQAKKSLQYGVPNFALKDIEVIDFKSGSQVASLSMNIYLSIIAILIPLSYLALERTSADNGFSFILFVLGGGLLVAAFYTPLVNAPGIYRKSFLQAEAYALHNKTPNHKWIRLNRIWSWIIWSLYGVIVPVGSFLYTNGGLSFLF